MLVAMVLGVFGGAANAAPTPIDAQSAQSLGMPRLHEPFTDCDCVAMTWDTENGPLTLEVPRDQVDHLEHAVTDGPNKLALVTTEGARIQLEEAPCVFAERAGRRYVEVLGLSVELVGTPLADDSTCGDTFQDLRAWNDEVIRLQHEGIKYVQSSDLKLASLKVLSSKGAETDVATVRRTLAATRGRAASCWTEGSGASVVVMAKGGALRAKRSGDAGVDACISEMVSATSIPAGKAKVKVVYGPPET